MKKSVLSLFLLVCGLSSSLCATTTQTLSLKIPITAIRLSAYCAEKSLSPGSGPVYEENEVAIDLGRFLEYDDSNEPKELTLVLSENASILLKVRPLSAIASDGLVSFDVVPCDLILEGKLEADSNREVSFELGQTYRNEDKSFDIGIKERVTIDPGGHVEASVEISGGKKF